MASHEVPGGDLAGPPGDGRLADAAFPRRTLAATQAARPRRPYLPCVSQGPLSLVNSTSVRSVELQLAERVEHAADAPVDFLDPVAIACRWPTCRGNCLARMERHVDGRVRQIEEERPVLVGA